MKSSSKNLTPLLISTGVITITIALYFLKLPFLEFMELKTYDLRFISRGPLKPRGEIALIVIDEKSLDELGRWPWPRSLLAELIDKLKGCKAKVIGFDIVLAEPDQHSELQTITSIRKEAEKHTITSKAFYDALDTKALQGDTDGIVARAIEEAGNVVCGYFYHTGPEEITSLSSNLTTFEKQLSKFEYPFTTLPSRSRKLEDFKMTEALSLEVNLPPFTSASKLSGYFNSIPDSDGTVRTIDLVTRYRGHCLLPLSLQLLRHYLDYPQIELKFHESGVEKVRLGTIDIACNFEGRMFINYRGGQKTFTHYSFTDIIHNRIPLHEFTDKIVLVGATATGIYDIRVTPFEKVFPGVEVHANVIDTILQGDFLVRSQWVILFDMVIIIAIGLFAGLLLPHLKARGGILFSAALFASYVFMVNALFSQQRLLVSTIYPLSTLLVTYLALTAYHYLIEEKEKRRIRATFQHYLAPSVVEEILKDPDKLKLGGEEKELTVLFSDIREFTSISERLSPGQIEQLLNEYFTAMTRVVFNYGGTLDKYMGDALMAFFGAPLDQPDHHQRACLTALGMMEELKALKQKWQERGLPPLECGIGINSGLMVVGNMGSASLFDYTVIGDNVNLGSRLEGLNKVYGTTIIVSEFTYHKVKADFTFRELDLVKVKGKEQAVTIYELLCKEDLPSKGGEQFLTHYQQGLIRYRNREWISAIEAFSNALTYSPTDVTTRLYRARCEAYKKTPPPDEWNGIYHFKEK